MIFSNNIAVPCPPPMQAEAIPYFTFLKFISLERVSDNFVPDAARGWPNAIAPPFTLQIVRLV